MKTKILLTIIALAGSLALTLNSCNKDTNSSGISTDNEVAATQTIIALNLINDDASFTNDFFVTSGALRDMGMGPKHPFGPNGNTTFTHQGDSIVKVVDFGSIPGLCNDGFWRGGRITITHHMHPVAGDTAYKITYDKFSFNGNTVSGTTTIVSNGKNTLGQPYWTITFNKTVSTKNGDVLSMQGTFTRTMTAGYDTKNDWTDDVFEMTGNSSFNNSKSGVTRTLTIQTPLVHKATCRDFVSGTELMTRSGKPDVLVDFGDGSCDNMATITINGTSKVIKI